MNTIERLTEMSKSLPESMLAELLDFAEFLVDKKVKSAIGSNPESLVELKGGLENSITFVGDPVQIQEKLRDEWR